MKLKNITMLTLATMLISGQVMAAEFTSGIVKKLDDKLMKVTIKHEELKNLEMPSMTMVFAVADEAMLAKLKVGETIQFSADRVNGRLTVIEVK